MNGYRPRMHRKLLPAAVALACALAAAGCGDDDGGDKAKTTTTAPLTKAQYVERADKICQATTAQLKKEGAKLSAGAAKTGNLPPQDEIVMFLRNTSVPTYERMLASLRVLPPPPDDAAELDGFLASLANAIDTVKEDPAKYSKTSAPDPFDDANARAQRYGMEICGS